ncbi:MAG: hypothetical protein AXA67_08375 [Methylothermaceae bacteria B42]|nr:MAG: hypothetical protein AXA67_08375 [Methylothermaceae bacteria B42]HHJ40451.1 hypothetical protein [Methylothermaceae bacterium]
MHQFSGARSAPYKIAGIYCFGCWQRVVRNVDGLDGRHQAPHGRVYGVSQQAAANTQALSQ